VLKKREQKALTKSFEMAQLATASMGKFDRKINDKEPDADKAMKQTKIKKQKQEVMKITTDRKAELERNMKVLTFLQKSDEVKAASRSDAHLNAGKMVKNVVKKETKKKEMIAKKRRQ